MSLPSSPRNLILGTAGGYSFNRIQPFLVSLQKCGYSGSLCLFNQTPDRKTKAWLQSAGYQHHRLFLPGLGFSKVFLPLLRSGTFPITQSHLLFLHFASATLKAKFARYFSYLLFLKKNRHRFDQVLLTDVRDVIFQKDPFDSFPSGSLQIFMEESFNSLHEGQYTYSNYQKFFGEKEAARRLGTEASCSGTILGSTPKILGYLEAMCGEIIKRFTIVAEANGGDQAIHNYLIWEGVLNSLDPQKRYNRLGAVLTMAKLNPEQLPRDVEGRFLNEDGSIIPILHQYTRHTALTEELVSQYRD